MYSKLDLLKKAHALLDEATPLKFDCGKLCGSRCCKRSSVGNTENPGMLLLPDEELLFDAPSFSVIDGGDGKLLSCNGACERSSRPFSCRIFPFYAETDGEKISLRPDPRAFMCCPVAVRKKKTRHSVFFHRNAVRSVRILMKDKDFKRELIKTSEFCDGLYSLYRKML